MQRRGQSYGLVKLNQVTSSIDQLELSAGDEFCK